MKTYQVIDTVIDEILEEFKELEEAELFIESIWDESVAIYNCDTNCIGQDILVIKEKLDFII